MNKVLTQQKVSDFTPEHRMSGRRSVASQPCGSRIGWCVIASYPQAEAKAATHLANQRYHVYLPLCLVRSRLVPLFPRYFFLWLDGETAWQPILYTRGVYDLLRSQDTGLPHIAPERQISALQAGEAARRIPTTPASEMWRPGMAARLGNGSLAGQDAVVMEVGKHNALVTILFLGQMRTICVNLTDLTQRDD